MSSERRRKYPPYYHETAFGSLCSTHLGEKSAIRTCDLFTSYQTPGPIRENQYIEGMNTLVVSEGYEYSITL